MSQNHEQVKDSLKQQDKPMDFQIMRHGKFTDKLSEWTLQLSFKKFWCGIREYPSLSKKAIKILFPFPKCWIFFTYFNQNNLL